MSTSIDERNRQLAAPYEARETNFWFHGRLQPAPHDLERERRIAWWRDARIGFFPHWSPMAGPGRGGAAVLLEGMSAEENRRWCEDFAPRADVAEHFADLAVACGAKYLVVTTNHCDGFKMWDSAATPFNSVRIGCRRDLVREQIDAARQRGLRIALYYSPSEPFPHLDERYIGSQPLDSREAFFAACRQDHELAARFRARVFAEMRELLTQYGPIDLWWNDGPQPPEILPPEGTWNLLRDLQPDMLINDRLVGGPDPLLGDMATQDYNESPQHGITIGRPGRDWECGYPINRSWSWVPEAVHDTASARELGHALFLCCSEQGNLLLSVAPQYDGTVDEVARERLGRFGGWVADHAEAIYGHGLRNIDLDADGRVVNPLGRKRPSKCSDWVRKSEEVAYLWVQWWPGSSWPISGIARRLRRAVLVATGEEVAFTQNGETIHFHDLPGESPDRHLRINLLRMEWA